MIELTRYNVTIDTPQGVGVIEVPSAIGPDLCRRRAILTACQLGWGDIHELTVTDVSPSERKMPLVVTDPTADHTLAEGEHHRFCLDCGREMLSPDESGLCLSCRTADDEVDA